MTQPLPKVSDLSPDQVRVMVATELKLPRIWSTALLVPVIHCDVPDYPNDLNAMHAAILTLKSFDKGGSSNPHDYPSVMFGHYLGKIVGLRLRKILTSDNLETYVHASPFETRKLLMATALQQAQAFLVAKGRAVL